MEKEEKYIAVKKKTAKAEYGFVKQLRQMILIGMTIFEITTTDLQTFSAD